MGIGFIEWRFSWEGLVLVCVCLFVCELAKGYWCAFGWMDMLGVPVKTG